MKKLNNKGFLLVETIVVATFTLTVLIALFLQFKNLLASYNSSYNYNTVEGIYNLNNVKDYISQYQNSANPINKQLEASSKPYLVLYNGSCSTSLGLTGQTYCDELMKQGNFKTVIFSNSDPTKLKNYLKSNEDSNISEEIKNLVNRLETVENQSRLIAEFNDGTLATIVFGVNQYNTPAPEPINPTPITKTIYRWSTDRLKIGSSIKGIETTTDPTSLGINHYLKHEVVNDKIISSYVCFVTNTEYCMKANDYDNSKALLQSQNAWFTSNGGRCYDLSFRFNCEGGGFDVVTAYPDGEIGVNNDSNAYCNIETDGTSYCYAYSR